MQLQPLTSDELKNLWKGSTVSKSLENETISLGKGESRKPAAALSSPAPSTAPGTPTTCTSGSTTAKSLISDVPPADRGVFLETYQCFVHCWFPIVNKAKLGIWIHSKDASLDSDQQMLLYTIFRLCMVDESLRFEQWDAFNDHVTAFLSKCVVEATARLERIQALLLSSLIYANEDNWDVAWLILGVAVRLGYQQELNRFDNSIFHKRTWYACCIIDTLISAQVGKVPHVSSEDFYADPLPFDGVEEWELWKPLFNQVQWNAEPARSLSIYNALFPLVGILNKLIHHINRPTFQVRTNAQRSMTYNELSSSLQLWSRNLPDHCDIAHMANSIETLSPQKAYLLLFFSTVNCLLYLFNDTKGYEAVHQDSRFLFPPEKLPELSTRLLVHITDTLLLGRKSPFFEYHATTCLSLAMKYNIVDQLTINNKPISHVFLERGWVKPSRINRQYFNDPTFPIRYPPAQLAQHPKRPPVPIDPSTSTTTQFPQLQPPSAPSTNLPQQPMPEEQQQRPHPVQGQQQDAYWDNSKMAELFDINKEENRSKDVPEFLHNLGLF
ncbi:hypothetical protein TRICI_001914 [Trichomonascus ciferrii]|uniref:Xylanolytic transcriptional activator regulatory domain-containing protein n=1 Tax=Trichomonascus ciferrii TaxID=44093 RepID=A0A642V735_9ASCO|nr:hypothetical protein TRICI_001914 [Trichomonascus ciferrii]